MKKIIILGSTGSIGINALKVADRLKDQLKVVGLTAFSNFRLLEEQIQKYSPSFVAVHSKGVQYLKRRINLKKVTILDVEKDIEQLVTLQGVDVVVLGICGSVALLPFLAAVRSGKTVAPANKEALVMAGHIIMAEAKKNGAKIIPVDSEQSAIFQCLEGNHRSELRKVYLTASGGPLRDIPQSRFDRISIEQILRHPRWKMGKKITVDSATLMNKGLEVMEAKWLFDLKVDDIKVLIHPEAVIHSMVEFTDGSILAQLGITDMRLPIQYALTYPKRVKTGLKAMDFFKLKKLTFASPDFNKFPALQLCIETAKKGQTFPCVLNAANEEATDAFLNGRIKFTKIYSTVERVVLKHRGIHEPNLKKVLETDAWAREEARKLLFN